MPQPRGGVDVEFFLSELVVNASMYVCMNAASNELSVDLLTRAEKFM